MGAMARRRKNTTARGGAIISIVVFSIIGFCIFGLPHIDAPYEVRKVVLYIALIIGVPAIISLIAYSIYLEFKYPGFLGKKPPEEIPFEKKKREQYENYYRTGNRRYLYDPNFNGRN